ncbi:MAG: sialidase family protein [Candidatus Thermoplasmatota archaeon]
MKSKNKAKVFVKAVLVFAVALAFILPGATAITNPQLSSKPAWIPNNAVRREIKAVYTAQYKPDTQIINADDDVAITGWYPGDDRLPNIALTPDGYPFVTWTNEEDVSTWNLGYAYATTPSDQEDWWNKGVVIVLTGPTQLFYGDTARYDHDGLQMIGVFMAYDTEEAGGVQIDDYTNYENWQFYTWTNGAPDPKYASIDDDSYYNVNIPSQGYNVWGPYNMYIHHEIYGGYDIMDCPICFHTDVVGQQGIGFFDAQSMEKTAPASDPDIANLPSHFHTVVQYNDPQGPAKIVWKKIVSTQEPDYEYTPFQDTIAEGTNPSIAAYTAGETIHVAVVYTDGDAVKCIYSTNDGETWQTPVTVAAAGKYPNICVINGTFVAAYINEGNLFVVESTDGGATWGTPEQINDVDGSVVEQENAVDMNSVGIVWVDDRGDDFDIYFQQLGEVQQYPKLDVTSITGGLKGAAAVLKNTGDAPATSVAWSIKVTGGILGRINKEVTGTIATLAVNEEKAIGPTGTILGFGSIQILVTATCAEGKSVEKTKDGTQFIIFTIIK